MTYDNELSLVKHTYFDDAIGNQEPVKTKTSVLCNVKSVDRREFYGAAANDLKPEIVFVINKYDYNGEKEIEFEGESYNVIRDYAVSMEELELTCEKVAGNV